MSFLISVLKLAVVLVVGITILMAITNTPSTPSALRKAAPAARPQASVPPREPSPAPVLQSTTPPPEAIPNELLLEPAEDQPQVQADVLARVDAFLVGPVGEGEWRTEGQALGKALLSLPDTVERAQAYARWNESETVEVGVIQTKDALAAADQVLLATVPVLQKGMRAKLRRTLVEAAVAQRVPFEITERNRDGGLALVITAPLMTEPMASTLVDTTSLLTAAGSAGYAFVEAVSEADDTGWRWETVQKPLYAPRSEFELDAAARSAWGLIP